MIQIIGAGLILISSTVIGYSIAAAHKKSERELTLLIRILEYMYHELQYNLTPLPELMTKTAKEANGTLAAFFHALAKIMDHMLYEDAAQCIRITLHQYPQLPEVVRDNLCLMGANLGRFDLAGQLSGLEAVKHMCIRDLEGLAHNRDERLRSYRTLAICAGVAIIILLI